MNALSLERVVRPEKKVELPWTGRRGMIAHFQQRGFLVGNAICKCGHNKLAMHAPGHDLTTEACSKCHQRTLRFNYFRPAMGIKE